MPNHDVVYLKLIFKKYMIICKLQNEIELKYNLICNNMTSRFLDTKPILAILHRIISSAYTVKCQVFANWNPLSVCQLLKFFYQILLSNSFFNVDFIFYSSFRFTAIEQKVQRVSMYPGLISPTIDILHHGDTFVKTNEPKLTHRYYSKSIVCTKVHSCPFYGFLQMYKWYVTTIVVS